jgi:hypothetical protein
MCTQHPFLSLDPNSYSWLHRFMSATPFSVVVSNATGVELFFLPRTVSGSGAARYRRPVQEIDRVITTQLQYKKEVMPKCSFYDQYVSSLSLTLSPIIPVTIEHSSQKKRSGRGDWVWFFFWPVPKLWERPTRTRTTSCGGVCNRLLFTGDESPCDTGSPVDNRETVPVQHVECPTGFWSPSTG